MPNVNRQTIYQMGNVVNDVVKQATGRDPVQAISMDYVTVEQNTLMGIETYSGEIVSFITPKSTNLKSLLIDINPVQPGTGDPSSENIRPITGWTGANVMQSPSTNLFDQDTLLQATNWEYSTAIPTLQGVQVYVGTLSNLCRNGTPFANELPVNFKYASGARYRIQCWWRRVTPSNADGLRFVFHYTDGTSSTSGSTSNNTEDFKRISYISADGKTVKKISLTYNSSTTVYIAGFAIEKYDGTQAPSTAVLPSAKTKPISWQTEAGTVYGGTLDVINGILTVTDAVIASYDGEELPSTWISDRDVYAEDTTPTTGAQVVYKLEEPVTYELTPQQITTLAGQNNVWANTGNVSLSYYVYFDLL